jgi:hypothetical protein
MCLGFDPEHDSTYDAFAYDAAYALAHALHDLIAVQNRTEVVPSELYETLIKRVRFDGVTGLIDFYDAYEDPDRYMMGDRTVGASYHLMNYADNDQGLVRVGTWTACGGSCHWSERWQARQGVTLTFSTADNSRPPQQAHSRVTVVRVGVLLPALSWSSNASLQRAIQWSPRMGVYLALKEINNKSDSVEDWMLPATRLEIAYMDPRCEIIGGMIGERLV